jgi:hypothetical protein
MRSVSIFGDSALENFSNGDTDTLPAEGTILAFASLPRNSMGFGPGSQLIVFATASRGAFSDPLKSLPGRPGFGRPKSAK